ncbi:hypothetical protein [Actinoallomurus iriomotensis]|uniref:Small secreted protein n=1 Tax=Actinoallomurus iriomotensis TaxID=478107 RepID=A0A9W6RMC0_9ACTN|nr:hypothetical protein [Actinoallomurus iriomotensis]GLY78303.1 hypothetical protein Airi01_065700 [Actinoallomurus iriomotensis]
MRISRMRITVVSAVTAALALSATACGGSEQKNSACDKLQQTIANVTKTGMTQVGDPNALSGTYANGAKQMREQGKDSGDDDVEKAANEAASAMDSLGRQMKTLGSGGTPQMPDATPLNTAGRHLKTACDG